jgi:hypothetical protein
MIDKKLKKLVKYSRMTTNFKDFFKFVVDTALILTEEQDERGVLKFLLHCQPSSKGKYFYLRNNHIFFQELFAAQNPRKILIALDKIVADRVLIRMNQLEQQREQVTGVSSDYWRSYVWKAMVSFVEKAAYCGQIRCVPRPIFPTHHIFRFHIRIYHLQGRMSRFFSLKMSKKQRHRLLNTVALIDIIFRRFTLGKI